MIVGCCPPLAGSCSYEDVIGVVDLVVMTDAQQRQVVDVGGAPGWWFEGDDVVRLAVDRSGRTQDAAAVSCDERSPLVCRGQPGFATVPQRLTLTVEDDPEDGGTAREPFEVETGDRTHPGDFAPAVGIAARDEVGIGKHEQLGARMRWPRRRGRRCDSLGATRSPFVADFAGAQMTLRLVHITLDCDNPRSVADFWSAALDRPIDDSPSELFASIGMSSDDLPCWLFIKVPEAKTAKNRMHIDMTTDDRGSEVARLVELGATHVEDLEEWGHSWSVMADVEGNEFCVVKH